MATLILTAVGNAVGGPIGGAIGSIIGQQIDNRLFAPEPRQGPRLGNLAVQTSTYGTEIPKIFGSMRVAGTVIWATDLIESRSSSGGGKGRPKTISYSYCANFAVALSGRQIRGVRRIWADGKLLRGSAGDFKSATDYRLYIGDEDQSVDPLIASAESIDQTPAFRGMAYAVFENFQLEDYGNRIPSLTFEIEADHAPVAIGAIAQELSEDLVTADPTPMLGGYAASGESVRAVIEALADAVPLSLAHRENRLRLHMTGESSATIGKDERHEPTQITRRAAGSVPDEVSLAYYDAARDFQTGLQRATTGRVAARNVDRRALPAALSAADAKALAEFRLAMLRAGRTSAKLSLGWARAGIRPGDHLRLAEEIGLWRVRRRTLGSMTVAVELVRVDSLGLLESVAATPGTGVAQPDLVHGPTALRLFDLPLGETSGGQPLLFAAAAGAEGWRRAALLASFDGGGAWQDAGWTAPSAIMGVAETTLAAAGSALFDLTSSVEVELFNSEMWLEGADDDALVGGANLALLGNELIQFGGAEWLGDRKFKLTRLLRGRRGSEWSAASHQAGEPFTLVERASLAVIEAPVGSIGGEARLIGSGVGDVEPAAAAVTISAESLRPPAPVHLAAHRTDTGDIHITWVRRDRLGWAWSSGSDTPLMESSERYRLDLSGEGFTRTAMVDVPAFVYTAADQAADGFADSLEIAVAQIGTFAISRSAMLLFE